MYADKEYIIAIRRELHRNPEIGFDLDDTVALVKRELESLGVECTEKYARSSVVATIGRADAPLTIGIRADMDALPITEKSGLPFSSEREGAMHACGHDAHTAMLLGTAKALKAMENDLACKVMLIFQPSEEGIVSGACELVAGGLMDDVDVIIGLHVENWLESGTVGVCSGASMASSRSFRVDFYGKSAHATLPHSGADALAALVRCYSDLQCTVARLINPFSKYVLSIGRIDGGTTQNVIADKAYMLGTLRTFDMSVDALITEKLEEIASASASAFGCRAEVTTSLKATVLYNDPALSEAVLSSARRIVGEEGIVRMPEKLSSEDFSQYLSKKPGVFFRLGTRNEAKGITSLPHNSDFMIDEDALPIGTDTCVQFVLDNMNGIKPARM